MSIFQMVNFTSTQKYGPEGGTTALQKAIPLGPVGEAMKNAANLSPMVTTVVERYMNPYNKVQSLGERPRQDQAQWGARAKTTQVGTQGRDYWGGTPVGMSVKSATDFGQIVYKFAFGKGKR